jgi:hypothetical protein
MEELEDIVRLLVRALRDLPSRKEAVREFMSWYGKRGLPAAPAMREGVMEIFTELNLDLSFYEPDPSWRAQDPSYFGDDRLMKEIEVALRQLSEVGIAIPGRP